MPEAQSSKSLLVVVDMQNDFISGSLGSDEAMAIVGNVCQKIRSWVGPVWYTKDTHDVFDPDGTHYFSTTEGHDVPVLHCLRDTDGWEIHPDVMSALEEHDGNAVCFLKSTYGSPNLATAVRCFSEMGQIENVVLVGLCTDVCVISNAMLIRAEAPDVYVYVDPSCCAGVTPERHNHALNAMQSVGIRME